MRTGVSGAGEEGPPPSSSISPSVQSLGFSNHRLHVPTLHHHNAIKLHHHHHLSSSSMGTHARGFALFAGFCLCLGTSAAFNTCPVVSLRRPGLAAENHAAPALVGPPLLRPKLRFTPLSMSSGGGGDRAADIAEWEQRLEDAVMDNDINAINAAVKKLDKLQGKDAGSSPFNKKAVDGKDFHKEVIAALGGDAVEPEGAMQEFADALQETAEETLDISLAAAMAALDDAVSDGNTEGIMRATKLIESLQGTAAKGEARQPPSAVGDELAEAIAEAAMDEGDDVDTLGILEGGGAAALRAAEMVLDDAVESGDSVAIENAARLLARLAAGDATFQEAADAGEKAAEALKAVGLADDGKVAVMDLAAAIGDAEKEQVNEALKEEEDDDDGVLLGGVDAGVRAKGLDVMLDEAVQAGSERSILDIVAALGTVRPGDTPFRGTESIDGAAQEFIGSDVSPTEVDAIASALAEAEEADEDGIDPFELLKGGGEGAKEAAAVMLQDAIDMGDEEGVKLALEALSWLGVGGDSPPEGQEGVQAALADAIAAAEMAEMDAWEDEEEEEAFEEFYEEEEPEEGGEEWKQRVVTGWDGAGVDEDEVEDEYVDDGRVGESWVAKARALADIEAEAANCIVVDCRFTRGKLLIKVENKDPDQFSVGIFECEKISRSLGYRLDNCDFILEDQKYNLVVSTPGAKEVLTREREFQAFKGYPITVTLKEISKGKTEITGSLHDREGDILKVNCKGRIVTLPISNVKEVRLIQDQTQAP